MASRANYVKIGLLVIFGLLALLALAVGLGETGGHRDTVAVYTYFNQSVQGLDVGAPVTFRGVRTGAVSGITIAPDHRMVEVRADIDVGAMERLGVWPKHSIQLGRDLPLPPPDLRMQLGSQGLTGVKFITIDYFDPRTNPPPELSFPVPEHYIPAAMSKGLEDSVGRAMDSITQVGDAAAVVVKRVDGIVADLEQRRAGDEAGKAIMKARAVLGDIDQTVQTLNRGKVAESAGDTLHARRFAANGVSRVVDRLDGDDGLVAATQRSVAAVGEVGRNIAGGTHELDATLNEFREALAAIRALADQLDREPDILLKGRAGGPTR